MPHTVAKWCLGIGPGPRHRGSADHGAPGLSRPGGELRGTGPSGSVAEVVPRPKDSATTAPIARITTRTWPGTFTAPGSILARQDCRDLIDRVFGQILGDLGDDTALHGLVELLAQLGKRARRGDDDQFLEIS